MIVAPNDRAFFVCVYIKIDASLITQNGCYVHLFSATTTFVFNGDVCVTMQIMSLTIKCVWKKISKH